MASELFRDTTVHHCMAEAGRHPLVTREQEASLAGQLVVAESDIRTIWRRCAARPGDKDFSVQRVRSAGFEVPRATA